MTYEVIVRLKVEARSGSWDDITSALGNRVWPEGVEYAGTPRFEGTLPPSPCDCELPGVFNSGVPGILARLEDGRIAREVERCDLCQCYPSDEAAGRTLREILNPRQSDEESAGAQGI